MPQPSSKTGRLFDAPDDSSEGEELLSVEGSLDAITFRNEENGFTIARLRTFEREMITVVGAFINPVVGESLQLWGRWETHRQYGPQFRVVRYQLHKPATTEAMERYLGSGMIHGIGAQTAKALVAYFGLDTIDVIEHHPERLSEVPGIGKQKAQWIQQAWEEQHEVHGIMLFLQGHGISATYATKIYRTYGDQAVEIVTANPYRLAQDIWGVGFKKADRIAQQLGLAQDTPERIEAGVTYCLQQASDQGHCFLPEELLVQGATDLLATPPEDGAPPAPGDVPTPEAVSDAVERLVRRQFIIRDTEDSERSPIYLKGLYIIEYALARDLRKLIAEPLVDSRLPRDVEGAVNDLCRTMGITPAAQQRQAVVESLRSRVLILTGGPGTGKTTTTRAILQAHLDCGRNVLLASPTGRAAKRLSEVTGSPAQTIHRLLEVDPKSFTFKRNAENPLECDALIIDEVSMVDLHLAFSLVRALPEGAQLILVGDADQLPSVGAGNVLHDLITSGEVPVVRLTEIFRQAAESTIITNAHKINSGVMPDLIPTSQWQSSDCLYIQQDDPLTAAQKIGDVVCRSLPSLGYNREDIQVLTPMQRGTLGAQHLNTLLQEGLNPKQLGVEEFTRGQKTLRCGDRVIQTVNNYEKEVFNGDIGYICFVDQAEKKFMIAYADREVPYTFEESDEVQLAYALTVHKSQGSEYPAVVLALHTQHYLLLQRNLLYTALTRAKKLALITGSKRAIAMAVRSQNRQERYTRLDERLQMEPVQFPPVEF
ncbi:MAG: SF1B family DNA helicase RecD2 [Armatimonadota bacterium]